MGFGESSGGGLESARSGSWTELPENGRLERRFPCLTRTICNIHLHDLGAP